MSNQTFEEDVKVGEILAHHGILNMRWGVWNDETKRKYGVLGPKRSSKASKVSSEKSKSPDAPKQVQVRTDQKTIASRIKERYGAYKSVKEQQKAEEAAKQKAAEDAAREKAKEDAETMSKYGITKEKYDAIRQATLNSNDPRVVIQGMKYLTDEELESKIKRLEQEGKVKSMAVQQQKDAAQARKSELETRQQTIPYKLGQMAVQSVKNQYLDPTLRTLSQETGKILVSKGKKALDSVRKDAGVQQATANTKAAKENAKNAAAKAKLEADAEKIAAERRSLDRQKAKHEDEREKQAKIAEGKALVEAILKAQGGQNPPREKKE